jgi:hypothetical protein
MSFGQIFLTLLPIISFLGKPKIFVISLLQCIIIPICYDVAEITIIPVPEFSPKIFISLAGKFFLEILLW